jgi:hypothetical protein
MATATASIGRSQQIDSAVHVYEQVADTTSKLVGPFRGIVKAIGKFVPISKGLKATTDVAQGFTLLTAPLTAISLVKNVQKVVSPKASLKDRVIGSLKGVSDTADLVDGAAKVCTLLRVASLVSEKITCWIPVFEWVNFFVRFIGLGFSVKENIEIGMMSKALRSDLKKLQELPEDSEKREKLVSMLQVLAGKDIKALEKDLDISKRANLKDRIEKLRERLLNKEDVSSVEDAKKFFDVFKKRVSTRLGFSVAGTANKVVGIVGGAFLFSPLSLVGVIILGISSCINFALHYSRKLLLSRNPLDSNEPLNIVRQSAFLKERVGKAVNAALQGMKSAVDRVQESTQRIIFPRNLALAQVSLQCQPLVRSEM